MLSMCKLKSNIPVTLSYWNTVIKYVSTAALNPTGIIAFNSLTKTKSPLLTQNPNILTWYVCGPTVYDSSHIGHAWSYVNFDILRRIMENYFDLNVIQVMNITDIDDKIINKAKEHNTDYKQVARKYESEFLQCLSLLGVKKPSILTRATDHMPHIISFIEKMLQDNFAYKSDDGSVYFSLGAYTKQFKYGKLKPADALKADPSVQKELVNDFALWKGSKFDWEPSWNTPWNQKGRPGWHIECSAMASQVFGSWLDVHSGGIDLLYPHHENEEAQCCAYHGKKQWVGHWIHSTIQISIDFKFAEHLRISGGVKMSKSLKNTIPVENFLKTHTADQFRMLCLMSNYRKEMEYSEETLKIAKDVLQVFHTFLTTCDSFLKNSYQFSHKIDAAMLHHKLEETKRVVREHLADDFNTAQSTTKVRSLITLTEREMKEKADGSGVNNSQGIEAIAAVSNFVTGYFHSLGFSQMDSRISTIEENTLNSVMDELNEFRRQVRNQALTMDNKERKRSLFAACDTIRKNLETQGIQIKDQSTSSTWSWKK
uniref:cysteine--tRNA ligase n=1 Tax=Evadne anonyx TaxID=141404 RepID=A0A9N6ZGD3_9CRUS|nr:EOG090X02DZ [Evadne anonyx]